MADDCYTFTIFDSFGDGICCNWGSGSYSLTSRDGAVLASGGSFSASENTDFCLNNAALLPVELLYFIADPQQNQVELDWATGSEEDNAYFEVERSKDGFNWENIDKVSGAGNSNTEIRYESIDKQPIPGLSYYRIKQVDYDGTYTYSDIETVNYTTREAAEIDIYPIPTSDHIYVESSTSLDQTQVRLLNNVGQAMTVSTIENGTYRVGLDLSNLAKGMYFLQLTEGDHQTTRKIFVK